MTGQQLLDQLSCRDKLLVSQAVYEYGSDAWPAVSKLLLQHPLIELPRAMLAPQSCSRIYQELLAELPPTIEGRDDEAAAKKPHARLHLRLAQKHYKARIEELRQAIIQEETEFASLANDVEQLRSGEWDDKVEAELRAKMAGQLVDAVAGQDKPAIDGAESTAKDDMELETAPQDADDELVESHATLQLDSRESDAADTDKPSRDTSLPANDQAKVDSVADAPAGDKDALPVSIHATAPLATTVPESEPKEPTENPSPGSPSAKPASEEPDAPVRSTKFTKDKVTKPTRSSRRTRHNPSPSPAEERETTVEPRSATTEKHADDEDTAAETGAGDESMQVDEEPVSALTEPEAETPRKGRQESRLASTTSPQTTNATPDAAEKTIATASRSTGRRGKRKADTDQEPSTRAVKRLREASENMDTGDEYEVSTPVRKMADSDTQKQFQRFITLLHTEISGHRIGNIFHKPVMKADAPDYHDIIKRPMDLSTIKRRFTKTMEITDPIEYHRDLNLMFCNSLMYNGPNTDIHKMAKSMMLDCEKTVQDFFQTHDVPLERPR